MSEKKAKCLYSLGVCFLKFISASTEAYLFTYLNLVQFLLPEWNYMCKTFKFGISGLQYTVHSTRFLHSDSTSIEIAMGL